jgi:hypothetical protein
VSYLIVRGPGQAQLSICCFTPSPRGVRMPRTLVITLSILLVASLVIVPKFVFSGSQDTKAETKMETCDLIVMPSTRYEPPC